MIKKALPIEEVFYSCYKLLFIFDNMTSYLVYIKDTLWVGNINKSFEG